LAAIYHLKAGREALSSPPGPAAQEHFGAHDLGRTSAKLCRNNGGDLEQIKYLLGHSSIQTTKHNDNLGL